MSDLPKGWEVDSISDAFELIREKGLSGVIPYLEIGNVNINNKKYTFTDKKSVKGCKRAIKGDVLISRVRPTRGAITQVKEETLEVSSAFTVLRNTYGFNEKYLFYYLAWNDAYLNCLGLNCTGTMYPTVSENSVVNFKIPIAPLPEQRYIVVKLEKLLHRVDACKERLEKIPAILKRFRQSVLVAACSGRLTADWREKNPDVRLECHSERREESEILHSTQSDADEDQLPGSWIVTALENLCDGFQYGTSTKSQKAGEVSVLRMGNIQNGKIDWTDLVYTSDEDEINKFNLKSGDVLFNRTNSPELVGKTAIYRGERPAIFAGYLIRIKNYPELNSEYLNCCLNTVYSRAFCQQVKTDGVSQSNINAQKLGKFPLPLPPLPEQQEIVRRVEALFKKADEIEARYKKAKAFVDRLTQSILAKTFRGELVPQDPKDEPAAVLLERIKAEKAKQELKRKAKKKQ